MEADLRKAQGSTTRILIYPQTTLPLLWTLVFLYSLHEILGNTYSRM